MRNFFWMTLRRDFRSTLMDAPRTESARRIMCVGRQEKKLKDVLGTDVRLCASHRSVSFVALSSLLSTRSAFPLEACSSWHTTSTHREKRARTSGQRVQRRRVPDRVEQRCVVVPHALQPADAVERCGATARTALSGSERDGLSADQDRSQVSGDI